MESGSACSKRQRSESPSAERDSKRKRLGPLDTTQTQRTTESEPSKKADIEEGWDKYRDGTEWTSLPPRWADESDLDKYDLDARIARCQRRIDQGIVPRAFRAKMEKLERERKARQKLIDTYPGLDWNSTQRIGALKMLEDFLEKDGDPVEELPNVRALIEAYRSKELVFDGGVTYWSGGEKVGEAKTFELKDFWRLNKGNTGEKGFWVEGVSGPGPSTACAKTAMSTNLGDGLNATRFFLRLGQDLTPPNAVKAPPAIYYPGNRPEIEMDFLDDTGSRHMHILKHDMLQLMGQNAQHQQYPYDQIMGYDVSTLADGRSCFDLCILVEVQMKDNSPTRNWMTRRWFPVMTTVNLNPGPGVDRLGGSWLRSTLYTATAPERPGRIYISDTKTALMGMLPAISQDQAPGPAVSAPSYAAFFPMNASGQREAFPEIPIAGVNLLGGRAP
ncbi:hypothetical protein N7492_003415 [Penicillium capsulatum]|uniref:Uncharacterized protein n=1 Tax=Penicillium capsulatum TaxID=69766 RepID=A0A9W9LWK0_9EURO|nr:hypothetical protein N7492_003415 [Penicillium capsulatum]